MTENQGPVEVFVEELGHRINVPYHCLEKCGNSTPTRSTSIGTSPLFVGNPPSYKILSNISKKASLPIPEYSSSPPIRGKKKKNYLMPVPATLNHNVENKKMNRDNCGNNGCELIINEDIEQNSPPEVLHTTMSYPYPMPQFTEDLWQNFDHLQIESALSETPQPTDNTNLSHFQVPLSQELFCRGQFYTAAYPSPEVYGFLPENPPYSVYGFNYYGPYMYGMPVLGLDGVEAPSYPVTFSQSKEMEPSSCMNCCCVPSCQGTQPIPIINGAEQLGMPLHSNDCKLIAMHYEGQPLLMATEDQSMGS